MKIIITGAGSFLGKAASAILKEHGHSVTELRHSYNEEPEKLPETADIWLHFAWAGKGSAGRSDAAIQGYNVEMTLDAVEKARKLGCRKFIFAGSQAEYGHAQDGTLKKEDGPVSPVSEYGKAKNAVFELADGYIERANSSEDCIRPMRYIHLRLFSVYGPGDHEGSLINTLIDAGREGKCTELGPCMQNWNYLYIDDAAEAIALICEKFTGGIYNIGGSDNRRLKDYVEELCGIMNSSRPGKDKLSMEAQVCFGARADNAEGPADLTPDIKKLKYLGFEQKVSFGEGIRRILEFKLRQK